MSWAKRYWGVLVGGGLILVLALLFFGMALAGWPGGYDTCVAQRAGGPVDTCYCEQLRSGAIKQPANTFSDLGFVIVGMILLAIAGRENGRARPRNPNPMNTGSWVACLFGLVVIFLGPGSMMFHASMTAWGGFFDSTSMYLLLAFLIGYDLLQAMQRMAPWLCWLGGIVALAVFMGLAAVWPEQATLLFGFMVILTLSIEVPIWCGAWGVKRSWLPLGLFIGTFLTSLLIWVLSKTGGPLCNPESILLQGHAWWHLGSAAAMVFLFWYLRSETGGRPVAT